jgi:WD40 repeat protein
MRNLTPHQGTDVMRTFPPTGRRLLLACALAGLAVLTPARAADAPRTDAHGDPLPDGALARLGTVRWRAGSAVAMTAFLPDGKSVLTISQDYVAQVWDRDTGKELRHFDAAGPAPTEANAPRLVMLNAGGNTVALSGDGKTLACPSRDGAVRVWDVTTGKEVAKLGDFSRTAGRSQLALSRDGKTLAMAVYPMNTSVWDVASAKELHTFNQSDPRSRLLPYRLTLSGDGKTLVQVGIELGNGAIKTCAVVWDAANGKELRRFSDAALGAGTIPAQLSAISPDAKLLAVPVAAKVKLIDLTTGKEARELDGGDGTSPLIFSPDGKLLVSLSGRNEGLTVWDVAGGKKLRQVGKVEAPAGPGVFRGLFSAGLSVSPDGKLLAWGEGPAIHLVDLETGKEKNASAGHAAAPRDLLFARDGKTVLTAGDDAAIRRWDAATGKELGQVALPAKSYLFVLPSPDGRVVAAGETIGTVHLIDATTGKETHALTPPQPVYGVSAAFSPDGKLLATVSPISTSVEVYDVASGQQKRVLPLPQPTEVVPGALGRVRLRGSRRAFFSPDGRLVAATDGALIVLFDVASGREERQIELPAQAVGLRHAVFSPDARTIAVEMGNGQIDVLEVASGQKRLSLNAQAAPSDPSAPRPAVPIVVAGRLGVTNPVTLAFSPDGRLLAQADDRKARLWDLYTGKDVTAFSGHRGPVVTVAFAPDGRRLGTASTDTTALLWDAEPTVKKLTAVAAPVPKEKLPALWTALAEGDAAEGHKAIRALAGDPAAAVPFLAERVKPATPPDKAQVAKLIANLDAEEFDLRESAHKELEKLGELALAGMREALKGRPSAEQRRALEELVKGASAPTPSAERLRLVRALEALELARTPEAVKVLKAVAAGAPDTLPTNQARAILTRLGEK